MAVSNASKSCLDDRRLDNQRSDHWPTHFLVPEVSKLIWTNLGVLIPKIILIFSHPVNFLRYLLFYTYFTLKLGVFLYTL